MAKHISTQHNESLYTALYSSGLLSFTEPFYKASQKKIKSKRWLKVETKQGRRYKQYYPMGSGKRSTAREVTWKKIGSLQ